MCWRNDFASDEFFCSKKVWDSSVELERMKPLSIADPVRIGFLNSGLRRFSNFFLVAAEDAAWFMMEFDISCPRQAFICSITLGGPVRSSTWVEFLGFSDDLMLSLWISIIILWMLFEIWGEVGTASMWLWCTPHRYAMMSFVISIDASNKSSFSSSNFVEALFPRTPQWLMALGGR